MDLDFFIAAEGGNTDAFKDKDKEIEFIVTPNKNTIVHVHLTSYSASETFVEDILGKCPTLLMKPNSKGETLLHIAARYGHNKIVKKLVRIATDRREAGAKTELIRARDNNNNTALHEAVCFHHTEIVDFLTKDDPDYTYIGNSDGETPLYIAVERAYWDVVLKILQNCDSPNQDGPNDRTALHAAIIRGNLEIVSKLLMMTSTSVNQADENGWVPLHLAALHRSTGFTEKLLNHERNTAYTRDKRGRTALHLAAHSGHLDVMRKIIEKCPDCAELVDDKGHNALHYSVISDRPYGASRVILDYPSLSNLYNERDYNGNTPLHLLSSEAAIFYKDQPLMKVERVDKWAFNKQNQTAADVAYDNSNFASSSVYEKVFLQFGSREVGALYGGRIIKNKDDEREKKQEDRQEDDDVVIVKNEKQKNWRRKLNRMRESNMLVAILIATVTFAAAFTLPGGNIQEGEHYQGSPVLIHNAAFQAFVITDSLSFVFSTSSCLILFSSSSLTSLVSYSYCVGMALMLTMLAMAFMVLAFVTGTYAVLAVSKPLAITSVILLVGLSFVLIFNVFFNMLASLLDVMNVHVTISNHFFVRPRNLDAQDFQLLE